MPIWGRALAATLLMQTTSSFIAAAIPLLAPILTERWALPPESIGYVSAATSVGICWYLACGNAMLEHLGPVRSLQLGMLAMGAGLALVTLPVLSLGLVGALLLGLGLAPNTPAGSQILIRTAPPRHRNLIFSTKQAGMPLGGALAGVLVTLIAFRFGFFAVICALGLLAALSILAVEPWRHILDTERTGGRSDWPWMFLSPSAMVRSVRVVTSHANLPLMAAIGVSLQLLQASVMAFTATYLVTQHGNSLMQAGQLMALLLAASAIARVLFGWVADRTRSGLVLLAILGLVAGGATTLLAVLPDAEGWPFLLCAVVVGATVLGWNGVHMAELARLAPADQVGEVTSAASLLGFIGTIFGPLGFALVVRWTGSFTIAYMLAAAQVALIALFVLLRQLAGGAPRQAE